MKKGITNRLNELIKKVPVSEDDYWIFFGFGEDWGDKCDRCLKYLESVKKPGPEAINCWKFEIWTDNLTDVTETFVYLLEEAEKDHTLSGKFLKAPTITYESGEGRMGTGISHTYPDEAKPDRYLKGEITGDRIFLIYNQSIEERDRRMKKIIGDLKERGLYKKNIAPYRRGCIHPHEDIIGPWEKWYSLGEDYK